ncbi:putative serine/threonine-protein kinase PIX13 [Bienertia sinuspersici]
MGTPGYAAPEYVATGESFVYFLNIVNVIFQ